MAGINPPRRARGECAEQERNASQGGHQADGEQGLVVFLAQYRAKRHAAVSRISDSFRRRDPFS